MSKTLSSVAKTEFDNEVKQAFQTAGGLRPTVTVRTNVVGDTYKFRKMGKGLANQKPSQADVTPMDVSHSTQTATLANWNAPEYTDVFDAATVNFDEQKELAYVVTSALGRRLDQLVIAALAAEASPAGTVTVAIGGANTDLNTAKMRRAARYLNDKGVPSTDRHLLHSAVGLESALAQTEVGSNDYNSVKALVQGEVNTFMGFAFHSIETRSEGGLTLTGNTRDGWAYHKSAVGLAIGIDVKTEVNYIPTKTSWLVNGMMKAGAVSRDGDGVVKVQTYES